MEKEEPGGSGSFSVPVAILLEKDLFGSARVQECNREGKRWSVRRGSDERGCACLGLRILKVCMI